MPKELEQYRIKISPHLIHNVLYYADLFIGEGATMASECAALGTPAVYVNSLNAGTLENQAKEGLIYSFRDGNGVLEKINEIVSNTDSKAIHRNKLKALEALRIDLPLFLTWLIENYPSSKNIVLNEVNWISRFK